MQRIKFPTELELERLPADGGEHWNRLVFEQSPYLLQHAANPVDWYPWGEEAFARARLENKPIFLSIGYATCHWCHVMERESFEDNEVAALLNRDFIAIKVDREERPDIDQLYMAACQLMSGSGGWPLTCFLTPQTEVFLAATYFPKRGRQGRPGMMQLLPNVAAAWQSQADDLRKTAAEIIQHLQARNQPADGGLLADKIDYKALELLESSFDHDNGGFGKAPKFPSPHQYLFLLRHWYKTGEQHTLDMVIRSLKAMRLGGLFDQVGFGFHRYSTDIHWLLPHFEKMLYDQALLLMAYSETYAATQDEFFKQTAEEIIKYLSTRMQSSEGGFFSAEDADSEGVEGKFYVWSAEELTDVLDKQELDWFSKNFNIHKGGNFKDEASGQPSGANIPFLSSLPLVQAEQSEQELEQWQRLWQPIREKLFQNREQRIHPLLDDKILTDWNGLMIAALARASLLLDNARCLEMAESAFSFIQKKLSTDDGHLLKRYRKGNAGLPAHLDDYAFMSWAAFELHQATLKIDYLELGIGWTHASLEMFYDQEGGGFYFTEASTELAIRSKDAYDGAIPSGNAVMARNLAHLFQLTGEQKWQEYFDSLVAAFAPQVNRYPPGHSFLLLALELMHGENQNLVFSGSEINAEILAPVKGRYLPNSMFLGLTVENQSEIHKIAPFTSSFQVGERSLHLCRDFSCELPIQGSLKIQARLKNLE
ncbi:MAG: thioredoxin domain-containing protein [Proteobacteria bacterium]|nr:thioredoxin domain-containing protein [Pseudomonadota bacterium]